MAEANAAQTKTKTESQRNRWQVMVFVLVMGRETSSAFGWHAVTTRSVALGMSLVAADMPTRGYAA